MISRCLLIARGLDYWDFGVADVVSLLYLPTYWKSTTVLMIRDVRFEACSKPQVGRDYGNDPSVCAFLCPTTYCKGLHTRTLVKQ